MRMVTAAEDALARWPKAIREVHRIRDMPTSKRLDAIMDFAYRVVGDDKRWPKPVRTGSRNQTTQIQRDAARHFALTILVEPQGAHGGIDGAPTRQELVALGMKMKAICDRNWCQPQQGESMEINQEEALMCPHCTHLVRMSFLPCRCPTCADRIEAASDSNPCDLCQLSWLLQNNTMKQRVDRIELPQKETGPEPPK
jgi:hypothetical protein